MDVFDEFTFGWDLAQTASELATGESTQSSANVAQPAPDSVDRSWTATEDYSGSQNDTVVIEHAFSYRFVSSVTDLSPSVTGL